MKNVLCDGPLEKEVSDIGCEDFGDQDLLIFNFCSLVIYTAFRT